MSLTCLVTGGAGFIGSHIAERLIKDGHTVRILDDLSSGSIDNLANIKDEVEFVEDSITNYPVVAKMMKGVDAVFHLAAMPFVVQSIEEPVSSSEINFNGTMNLLDAARLENVGAFVFSSSSAVYGDSKILPVREDLLPEPLSPYAGAKLASEYYLTLYAELYNLPTINLRYMNVFGPKQNPESYYSAVIVKFIQRIITDRGIEIYGDGEQTRDFIYVEDVVNANMLALENLISGKVKTALCNVGSGTRISINDLVKVIEEISGKTAHVKYEPERIGEIKHSYADVSNAENKLGFKASVEFKYGLQKVLEYIQNSNM